MLEFDDLNFVIVGSIVEIHDDQGNTIETLDADQSHGLYNFLKAFLDQQMAS